MECFDHTIHSQNYRMIQPSEAEDPSRKEQGHEQELLQDGYSATGQGKPSEDGILKLKHRLWGRGSLRRSCGRAFQEGPVLSTPPYIKACHMQRTRKHPALLDPSEGGRRYGMMRGYGSQEVCMLISFLSLCPN